MDKGVSPGFPVVARIEQARPKLVVFDLGGTLFDFLPVHQEAFVEAAGVHGAQAERVRNAVAAVSALGLDSFVMAARACRDAGLSMDPHELAVRKRALVEVQLRSAQLEAWSRQLLRDCLTRGKLAILTLGLIESTRAIIDRSLDPETCQKILALGRPTIDSRVNKSELLRTLAQSSGAECHDVLYVGDALIDAEAARSVGSAFMRFAPFSPDLPPSTAMLRGGC